MDNATNPRSKVSILIVDDNTMVLGLIKMVLEDMDFLVDTAGTAKQAMACIDERRGLFDLVILDQQLPDSRGIDMMRRVKEQYPALRFMMVSGLMTEDVIQGIKDAGGESVLGKPFDVAELMTAVEKALGE